ncbi:MAG: VanW family protein [Coriobacteriales bacterium]|nr:VanW family protein [Coriobacteriales bacterium]
MTTAVSNKIFTLPNLISFTRLLLVPVFAVLFVGYHSDIAAFILFLVAITTDFVDGAVARATNQVSRLGQQLDPLVDRVLILTAVILVFIVGRVPVWILVLLVARDACMLVLLFRLRAVGQINFKVAFIGKLATACNMVGFCFLILNWPELAGLGVIDAGFLPGWGSKPAPLGIWFLYAGVILAWIAGIYYILRARQTELLPPPGQRATTYSATARGRFDGSAWDHKSARRASSARRTTAPGPGRTTQKQKFNYQQGAAALFQVLNTPKKLLIALAVFISLIVLLFFYSCDGIKNFGVIHQGVQVGVVNVSQMKEDKAADLLTKELNALAMQTPVNLFATETAAQAGVTSSTVQLGNGVNDSQIELNYEATSWSITPATLNAEVSGTQLAEEAYGVGRGADFFLGRIAANTLGVTLKPRLDISEDRLTYLESMLTQSIGTPMCNASMSFDGKNFIAKDGQDGFVVNSKPFEKMLQQSFFSEDRTIVVPMVVSRMQVGLGAAKKVAEQTQQAIAEPVYLTYVGASWTLTTEQLGQVITSSVQQDEAGNWKLVPTVDPELLKELVPGIIGQIEDQIVPLNAEFVVVDGALQIMPSQNGTGIDYKRLAQDINSVLFGQDPASEEMQDSAQRVVPMYIGILEAELQYSDLAAFEFATKVGEFTLKYPYVPQASITNIHAAADHLNSTIIAPQEIWSFIDTVGEFTAENGFVDALVIVDGAYADGMGGGSCTAASTVYNAVYEAGYPIVERVNHSLRITRYPLGRDAAIAYPYADLKFKNDTDNYLLLTMTYTDDSVTCILWGIPPGYKVESIAGELVESGEFAKKEVLDEDLDPGERYVDVEGLKASKVEVTRVVYNADGSLKEKRIFYSSYDSTTEITKVGPE